MINFESEILFPYIKLLAVMAFMVFVIGCFLLSICHLLDMFEDRLHKKQQIKRYLQEHRFERFRVAPFVDDRWIVGEYIGVDTNPLVIAYCNDWRNAQNICDILNMDFLGETYSERNLKKILATADCADINNLKVPRKEGERTDEK